jgi:hypothetical protein
MQTFIVLAALAVLVGVVVWVNFVLRKFKARKAFEREREAQFVAEMLRAKPAAKPAAAATSRRAPSVTPASPARASGSIPSAACS